MPSLCSLVALTEKCHVHKPMATVTTEIITHVDRVA